MPTIAIVGAGPQLGRAIARTYGSHGYDVALIARNRARLEDLAGELAAEGTSAAAFPADVLDRTALTQALKDAASHFGGIDVLEYSPVGGLRTTVTTTPAATEPAHVQHEMDFQLYGAIAATRAVLPAMREAGAGTLLFTTGAGSVDPVPQIANVNAAAAALRNWVINLHKELDGTGVQAAHVAVNVSIGTPAVPGFPTAQPEEIAPVYWDLHTTKRDQAELVFSL
ncbi:SDR family NAD(P)-dependent oxidoreductase [Yinghuangia sp. ASG 101]|uniref:SDR family NAD(P)-dependent oxidoreductase n=1 Tax=Yinghuangia sp. ASG 101 TaxID=2896848 RepID=UPI001E49EA3A|nr:SDR family NAD(P)-dependent oxidoreductase [Yinghuangia sp. ASG 101]UGQ11293.1 SDR family NAD(P)-dependent oxidoreductase [Yinghuangia sp. ASG 101]